MLSRLRPLAGNIFLITHYLVQAVVFYLLVLPLFLIFAVPLGQLRRWRLRTTGRKPRILWAPLPIINIHYNARADRIAGYESDTLVYTVYHIVHGSLFRYNLARWYRWLPLRFFIPLVSFFWASLRYDIFNFFYIGGFFHANSFLKYVELPLLRLAGKKIILFAYGADVRLEKETRVLGTYHCYYNHPPGYSERPERIVRRDIAHMMKWGNASISMGDMLEYTPGSENDLFYWPIDIADWQPHYPDPKKTKEVTIVHAPNNRIVKGSDFLIEIVERLKKQGYPINLVLVEKMPNDVARKHYEQADIFAEQFLIGWHGFTAIEVMALGKPLICYIRKKEYLLDPEQCPIISANPDNLEQELKRLIENPRLRHELGKQGRAYVEKHYSLEAAAERFAALYQRVWNQ